MVEYESKGVRASGYCDSNGFVIIAGSFAVGDEHVQSSLNDKPRRVDLREDLIRKGTLKKVGAKYQFTIDYHFNSPSEAASIIWGSNLNGPKVFGLNQHQNIFQQNSNVKLNTPEIKKISNIHSPKVVLRHHHPKRNSKFWYLFIKADPSLEKRLCDHCNMTMKFFVGRSGPYLICDNCKIKKPFPKTTLDTVVNNCYLNCKICDGSLKSESTLLKCDNCLYSEHWKEYLNRFDPEQQNQIETQIYLKTTQIKKKQIQLSESNFPEKLDDTIQKRPKHNNENIMNKIFDHLRKYHTISEKEVVHLLGNAREGRRFASKVEEHAKNASMSIHIEVIGGIKQYVYTPSADN